MRILILTESFLPKIGGAEIAVHNLAKGLVSSGHDVLVVCPRNGENCLHHNYVLRRYPVLRGLYRTGLIDCWVSLWLYKIIKQWRPEIIHAHFAWPSGFAAMRIKTLFKLPVVITSHGADIQKRPDIGYGLRLNPRLDKKIRFALLNADFLVAISSDIHHEYVKIGVDQKRIADIPNCIDWALLSQVDNSARERLGMPSDQIVLLAIGRNHPIKGFADLIQIIGALSKKHPEMICLIVGKDVPDLDHLLNQIGAESHVRLFDQVLPVGIEFEDPEIKLPGRLVTFLKAADIYVMPSLLEGLPVAAIEAMAAGLPVVATRTSGIEDLIQHGINGFLIPLGDREALAESLSQLILNSQLRDRMGKASRQIAAAYDKSVIAAKHLEIYHQAISHTQRLNYSSFAPSNGV